MFVSSSRKQNSQQRICWVSISGAGEWRQENAHPEKTEQSWNLAGTFQEPCWNRAVLEPCWSLAGILLECCRNPHWNWNHVGTFELLPWLRCLVVILGPKDKFWSFVCFFHRASERRVLLIAGVCQTFSHLHIFT